MMACHSENTTANHSNCELDNVTSLFTYQEEMMMLVPWTVLIISSAIIYVLIFVAVLTEKEFRNASGYLLMSSLGVSDMLYLASNTLSRFRISYLFHHGMHIDERLLITAQAAVSGCFSTSLLHIAIIAYNRYVAVKKYYKYKDIFSRKHTFMFISLAWLTGIAMFAGDLLIPDFSCARYEPHYFTFRRPSNMSGEEKEPCKIDPHTFVAMFLSLLMIISSVILYSSVLHALRKVRIVVRHAQPSTRSQDTGSGHNKQSKTNRSHSLPLTIQFLVVTCVFLVSYAAQVARFVMGDEFYKSKSLMAFSLTAWVINFSINPFVYICVNRRLRKAVRSKIHKVLHYLPVF